MAGTRLRATPVGAPAATLHDAELPPLGPGTQPLYWPAGPAHLHAHFLIKVLLPSWPWSPAPPRGADGQGKSAGPRHTCPPRPPGTQEPGPVGTSQQFFIHTAGSSEDWLAPGHAHGHIQLCWGSWWAQWPRPTSGGLTPERGVPTHTAPAGSLVQTPSRSGAALCQRELQGLAATARRAQGRSSRSPASRAGGAVRGGRGPDPHPPHGGTCHSWTPALPMDLPLTVSQMDGPQHQAA